VARVIVATSLLLCTIHHTEFLWIAYIRRGNVVECEKPINPSGREHRRDPLFLSKGTYVRPSPSSSDSCDVQTENLITLYKTIFCTYVPKPSQRSYQIFS